MRARISATPDGDEDAEETIRAVMLACIHLRKHDISPEQRRAAVRAAVAASPQGQAAARDVVVIDGGEAPRGEGGFGGAGKKTPGGRRCGGRRRGAARGA